MPADDLIAKITAKVGITPDQAKAGLGLVLKLAKENLGPKYSELAAKIPGADALIAAAPAAGGLGGMLGGLGGMLGGNAGKLAGLASLMGGAQKVGLDKDKMMGIAGQAGEFLKAKGGPQLEALLKGVMK